MRQTGRYFGRREFFVTTVFFALAHVACGGGGSSGSLPEGNPSQASGEEAPAGGTASQASVQDANDLDPGILPPAGQATLEVDGESFVFLRSETLSERLFACEVTPELIRVNFQSDGHDLLVQARVTSGEWEGNLTARPRDVDGGYGSSASSDGGRFAVEGKSFAYAGNFRFSPAANPAAFEDVGEGRVAVTCP